MCPPSTACCKPQPSPSTALLHLQLLAVPRLGDVLLAAVVLLIVAGGAPDESISFWLRNLGIVDRENGRQIGS